MIIHLAKFQLLLSSVIEYGSWILTNIAEAAVGGSHNKRQEWGSNCGRKGLEKSLLEAWEGFWY